MPKGQYIEPTTKRTHTLERLQELRREADKAGDAASRDILDSKITEQGGVVPSNVVPKDETPLNRLQRLQMTAREAGDQDTAGKIGLALDKLKANNIDLDNIPPNANGRVGVKEIDAYIAELPETRIGGTPPPVTPEQDAPTGPRGVAVDTEDALHKLGDHCTRAVDGGMFDPEPGSDEWTAKYPHPACEATAGNCARASDDPLCIDCNNGDNYSTLADAQPAPGSDEERSEGPEATQEVNNGTASVNAKALIAKNKYILSEIPARFGGKVDLIDVKAYSKILAAE